MDDLTLTQQLITSPQETASSSVSVWGSVVENADLFLSLFSVNSNYVQEWNVKEWVASLQLTSTSPFSLEGWKADTPK